MLHPLPLFLLIAPLVIAVLSLFGTNSTRSSASSPLDRDRPTNP
jgi:hypothetical protein